MLQCYMRKSNFGLQVQQSFSEHFTDVTQQAVTDTHPPRGTTPLYLIGLFN